MLHYKHGNQQQPESRIHTMTLEQLKALKTGDKVRCFWNHPSGETIDKVETVTVPWSRENDFGEPSALLKTLRITPYNYQHFTIVSKSETPMTLVQIAQTFPPMWQWNHQQEQIVAEAIKAIVGQTFICNHPNMQGVETTVVEQHPHSRGVTLFLHSPSRADQSVVNHECDIFHFAQYYTPIANQ